MKIKLSVIIPCYNHGAYLPDALESVRAVKRDDIEVIVVDDGSSDPETKRIMQTLASDPSLTLIQQPNGGLASARNAAIMIARGEYILPLDADNKIRPDYVRRGIEQLDAHPQIGVVYGDAQYFGSRSGRWKVGPFDRERLLYWNYIDACAVIRRAVWEQNGGYRRDMPVQGLEDWEFWLNTLSHGWQFAYIPEVMFDYRVMPGSMIERAQDQSKTTENYIADHYGRLYRSIWLESISASRSPLHLLRLIRQQLHALLFRFSRGIIPRN